MSARILCALAAFAALSPAPALAWGPAGHRWVASAAVEALPAELPAFLRMPAARADIGEFATEPDRSRSAGKTHGAERDPGHYIDMTDDGKVMGVMPLSALPDTRAEYDAQLNAGGSDQYKAGYLPYSIVDGFQQLAKDFGYWRAASIGEQRAATAADRAWFAADRKRREALVLRDLGVWSHYVGDAAQPQHVSVHSEIWGDYPNPQGYIVQRGFHIRWEDRFVQANVSRAAIAAGIAPFRDCKCPLFARVEALLTDSLQYVGPLYAIETKTPFPVTAGGASPEQIAFATQRLSRAASEVRDLIVLAWRASAQANVGYPVIPVADIESGKVVLTRQMLGGE